VIDLARRFGALLVVVAVAGCFRGKLPARQFYRLTTVVDSTASSASAQNAPLAGSIAIMSYDTPGIYGSGSIVYRAGEAAYGAYPSREWAIPLGDMLGTMTEMSMRRSGFTSARATTHSGSARRDQYEWRGGVREFDEVDTPTSVSASVALSAQLVRVADDSVVWSGTARETQPVRASRSMDSVIEALSISASRAISRLTDDAASALRRLTAAGAQGR